VRAFAEWLAGTDPSLAIQSTFWLIRLLQATHLLTAGVVTAAGVMIVLRVLGWQRRDQPFERVWCRFSPWLSGGLIVMLATGIAQTFGDPVRELTATSYWLKMVLLLAAVTGTASVGRAERRQSSAGEFSLAAKVIAAGLLLCWLAVPLLGRMIAYDRAFWGGLSLRA
jgi:multisubunit Na+/H+ antiporter MnhB subunit